MPFLIINILANTRDFAHMQRPSLNLCADVSSGARGLNFVLSLCRHPSFVFVGLHCTYFMQAEKAQKRLRRNVKVVSKYQNLMCLIKC